MPACLQKIAKKFSQVSRGFTLIELLVVIAIIGILTAIGTASYGNAQVKGRDAKRKADLKQIQAALELYKADYGHYPMASATGCPSGADYWWFELSNSTVSPTSWIRDCATNPPTNLATQYMQSVPKDPINNSTSPNGPYWGYSDYLYVSADAGTCTGGQYYLLMALLENHSDPDRAGVTFTQKFCNWITPATDWSPYLYVLTNP